MLAAADEIIEAFGRHDADTYFSLFDPDTTFVFYTASKRLNSRAEYEALWRRWETDDGFRVHGCSSTDRRVQLFDSFAIFTHSVETQVEMGGEISTVRERETIVFEHRDSRWIAVHEHLSPIAE